MRTTSQPQHPTIAPRRAPHGWRKAGAIASIFLLLAFMIYGLSEFAGLAAGGDGPAQRQRETIATTLRAAGIVDGARIDTYGSRPETWIGRYRDGTVWVFTFGRAGDLEERRELLGPPSTF